MTQTMTRTERRKAQRLARRDQLLADYRRRCEDPTDPLHDDPVWNMYHADYHVDGPDHVPGADTPTPNPRNDNGQTRRLGASSAQIEYLATLLRDRLSQEPLIVRILAALDNGTPLADIVDRQEASTAIDHLKNAARRDNIRRNRFADNCRRCGTRIPADEGSLINDRGSWVVEHIGDCPPVTIELEAKPAAPDSGIDLTSLPRGSRGMLRVADPRHITDPDSQPSRLKLRIDQPNTGKWAGWVFVKDDAEYGYGQRYGKQAPGRSYIGDVEDILARIIADPTNALAAYGQLVGSCGICGRRLEDQDSIDRGIGPVCFGKLSKDGV